MTKIEISPFEPCFKCLLELSKRTGLPGVITGVSPSNTFYGPKMKNDIYEVSHRCGAKFYFIVYNGKKASCQSTKDTYEEAKELYEKCMAEYD